MLAALQDAKKEVGGTDNVEIAFHLEDGQTVELDQLAHPEQNSGQKNASNKDKDVSEGTDHKKKVPPPAPLKPLYGPFLNFHNVDLDKNVWLGNILYVHHMSRTPPRIHVHSKLDGGRWVDPVILDEDISGTGYSAVRYDLQISLENAPSEPLLDATEVGDPQARHLKQQGIETGEPRVSSGRSQKVTYTVDPQEASSSQGNGTTEGVDSTISGGTAYEFYVAARDEPWHWAFYSCNGFGTDTKNPEEKFDGVRPLWRDKLAVHKKRPLHLMVGCGDQIYQDDFFFHCQSLRQWLDITNSVERESYQFTVEMQIEVERYYLMHYLAHFSQPVVGDAMAAIPSINIVDDHDIFDGFGSYPDPLQQCPVFQAIGKIALRFYLLFQHHTTTLRARDEGLWGGSTGYNFLRLMGPRTAIFGSDGRFERKKTRVCDPKTWDMLFEEYLPSLPPTVEHLIFAAGVPVSFPVLGVTEKFRTQANLKRDTKHVYEIPPLQDPRLMYNIVSSAIGNIPPPKIVLKLFQWSSSRKPVLNVPNTTEGLVHIFQHDVDGHPNKKGHRKIMARRNWCEIDEVVPASWITRQESGDPVVDEKIATPELAVFRLRFEPPKHRQHIGIGVYHVSIPRLVVGEKEKELPGLIEMAEKNKEMGVGVAEMDEKVADEAETGGQAGQNTSAPPVESMLSTPSLFSHPEPSAASKSAGTDGNAEGDGIPLQRQQPNEWPTQEYEPGTLPQHPFGYEEDAKGKGKVVE
ncbi:uncharacterized protein SPPG_08950 [Spizellomyces punctatus DAOM BR117]|uniref:PhoD-like phosphatase domain-containing protein n=1 Tax=Spizellomyces punctatus (strain DAOM BR117) TaxID=645134 RepID=A0A0L0HNK0_SPIPD|nr:uncharacterized protein SPPG_08950 [Spizellomyces punctatus DAOM BR117]KND02618.1 hypothetical protein SPPG_08950 [Spizellomyces punctatus DAOM BR117]|eukprot:XP_016610657.1 hypothetical protein SPPG_08950 [Spizellomyces punctatus DAOM BR117]